MGNSVKIMRKHIESLMIQLQLQLRNYLKATQQGFERKKENETNKKKDQRRRI